VERWRNQSLIRSKATDVQSLRRTYAGRSCRVEQTLWQGQGIEDKLSPALLDDRLDYLRYLTGMGRRR